MSDLFRYSHPFGDTITATDLQQQFAGLQQWEDKHRQLITLAGQLPPLPEAMKQRHNVVTGCQHQVWFIGECQPDERFHFYADSDSRIVKGLLAVLLTAVEGKTATQLLATNPLALFDVLQLQRQLSASRGEGLAALSKRIQQYAAAIVKKSD